MASRASPITSSYDLELERVIARIKEKGYKRVLLQLPDGLKIHTQAVADELSARTGALVISWMGSNYGACDIPLGVNQLRIDAVIAVGHNVFLKNPKGW